MSLPIPLGRTGTVDVVVIGAGHCGLAMSYYLSRLSIRHVVLERGVVANSWRNERWDSLRLLTPNWMSSLPGHEYAGSDPDGFMSMPEVADFVSAYAARIDAPIRTNTTVKRVRAGMFSTTSLRPEGQRTTSRSALSRSPNPKTTSNSLCERNEP